MITRQEYKEARRFIRDNGFSVIHWLSPRQMVVFSLWHHWIGEGEIK